MNRTDLEKILKEQRARRLARKPASSSAASRKRTGWWTSFFVTLLGILFVFAGVVFGMMFLSMPQKGVAAEVLSLPSTPLAASTTAPASTQAVSVFGQVCTDIPYGRLHVRFAPGEGSEVRGYLAEGEAVQVALVNNEAESQTVKGDLWLHISSPVAGWVNAAYICKRNNP